MSKPEWGIKRVCYSCGAKFYDLEKEEIICPACGEIYDPEAHHGHRRDKLADDEAAPAEKDATELKDDESLDVDVEVEDVDIDTNDDTLLVDDDDAEETLPDVKPFDDSEES